MKFRQLLGLFLLCGGALVQAQIPIEKAGLAGLAEHTGKGWFWVGGNRAPSQIDGRYFLFDDQGKMLGQLNNGFWPNRLQTPTQRNELVMAESYFSRGTRGERSDVVTIYDGTTLKPKTEIRIPPKRINALGPIGLETLSDDERFMLVVNYTPAQSVSIVDLKENRFVTEVETPGCSSIYAAGKRDFFTICGDGGFLHLRIDEKGQPVLRQRVAPLFDPLDDYLTTAAARRGNTWYFVSRLNNVYAIEMSEHGARLSAKWPLVTEAEHAKDWRISGSQHVAVHQASGQLYVLMHQGEEKTRQEPGTEVWVYDLGTQKKIRTIPLHELTLSIAVSQDAQPKLYTIDFIVPMPYLAMVWIYLSQGQDGIYRVMQQAVSIYDAERGKRLHHTRGLPNGYLNSIVPW